MPSETSVFSPVDEQHMHSALALAKTAKHRCPPNPAVGCVIVDRHGVVIGQGATQPTGGPHAEVMALQDLAARGHTARASTVYVTLEPCAHYGRTPPCTQALVAAAPQKVIIAMQDPNPLVAGRGCDELRSAGITVELGLLADAAWQMNLGFFSRIQRGRPWVRSKIAMSTDAHTALLNGTSQWITSPESRADGHVFRASAGAILTGIGTILADDPQLNVRLCEPALTERQPWRVIVDAQLRTPPSAKCLQLPGTVRIYTATPPANSAHRFNTPKPHVLPYPDAQYPGRVDLAAMLRHLAADGINEVHLEAGPKLNGAMLQADLIDELLIYVAPTLLGPGRPIAELPSLTTLDNPIRLRWQTATLLGPDLRLQAIVNEHDAF